MNIALSCSLFAQNRGEKKARPFVVAGLFVQRDAAYCGWPLSLVPSDDAAFAADAPFRCAALFS